MTSNRLVCRWEEPSRTNRRPRPGRVEPTGGHVRVDVDSDPVLTVFRRVLDWAGLCEGWALRGVQCLGWGTGCLAAEPRHGAEAAKAAAFVEIPPDVALHTMLQALPRAVVAGAHRTMRAAVAMASPGFAMASPLSVGAAQALEVVPGSCLVCGRSPGLGGGAW